MPSNSAPPPFSAADHAFMALALKLAARGLNTTTPNPRVGCVLVKSGKIIGQGWHVRAGEPHAEVLALREAGENAKGATAYITLEPCNHHGRTPPCTEALIDAGIARVVSAMQDPNPQVAGAGLARLAAAGIATTCGLLASEAAELNIGFISRMTRHRPWVRLKIAASLDGKTALENGQSQWITGSAARRDAHAWRARSCAILTGSGTVRDDNPSLTVRDVPCERAPMRILIDGRLSIPPTARLFSGSGKAVVFHTAQDADRLRTLAAQGVHTIACREQSGHVDLKAMLEQLGALGCNEVLVEGGARLNGALLQAGLVDELLLYFAPTLLGTHARGMFDFPALTELSSRHSLDIHEIRQFDKDLRLIARISSQSGGSRA